MTAASPTFEEVRPELSAAERSAIRSARIRGVIMAALGLFALNFAAQTMDVAATFSFWVDKAGGNTFTIATNVGLLWILTGVVTGVSGILQLVRGPSFQWRRALLVVLPFWVAATFADLLAGKPANVTIVFAGTLTYAAPISLGAFAGIIAERSGLNNIAIEGKFNMGACAAAIVASATMLILGPGTNPTIGVLAGILAAAVTGILVSLLLAWLGIRWRVDQIIAGIVINIGAVGLT